MVPGSTPREPEWARCFYCSMGQVKVSNLPCGCPVCGQKLTGLYEKMSTEQQRMCDERKMNLLHPTYYMAS